MIGEEGEPKVSHLRRLRFHLPHLLTFLAFFRGSCVHVILVRCGKKVKTTKREHVAVLPVEFFY